MLQALRVALGADDPRAADALARVEFHCADLFAPCAAPLLGRATHALMCSSAFSAAACREVAQLLAASPAFQVGGGGGYDKLHGLRS